MSPLTASTTAAGLADRRAKANLRAAIYNGDITLAQLLERPPIAIGGLALVDVIRWTRSRSRRNGNGLATIGRKAVHDGINLLVTVERASQRSLQWVAENGYGPRGEAGQGSPASRGGAKRPGVVT